MQQLLVSYAQNREDLILEGFFGDVEKGFYVDVGANHPIKHSVTKLFYQKGWRGIHIEPNNSLCAMLRFDRPEDTVLNVGVSDKEGALPFTEYANHGLSTFSESMQDEYSHQKSVFTDTFHRYEVPVRPLADLFVEQKVKHIHFMKVDVEGYEYEVLAGNDWKKYHPEMICIESNHIVKDWRPLLAKQGYTLAFNDGLNDYYLAKESQARAKQFSYAKRLLESGEVVTQAVDDKVHIQEMDNQLGQMRLADLHRQKILAEVQADWYEHAPLRWMIKKSLRAFDTAMNNRLNREPQTPLAYDTTAHITLSPKAAADDLRALSKSYAGSLGLADPVSSTSDHLFHSFIGPVYRVLRKIARLAHKVVRG
jgi:FkbM family methyltransferase